MVDTWGYKHALLSFLIPFPLQQWLLETASMLRYTYSACRVVDYRSEKLNTKKLDNYK